MFAWYIFFIILFLTSLCHYVWSKFLVDNISLDCGCVCVYVCVLTYSVNLCLLICEFRAFIFKVFIDMLELKSVILLFVFCLWPLILILLFLCSYLPVGYLSIFSFILISSWFFEYIAFYSFLCGCCRYYYIHTQHITVYWCRCLTTSSEV